MGSVKIDIHKEERRLEQVFPVDSEAGVVALLENLHYVRELRFKCGDYAASDLLLDFERSVTEASLTEKQREVLFLLYEHDLTQQQVGSMLGVSQQAVVHRRDLAVRRIARVNKAKEDAGYGI